MPRLTCALVASTLAASVIGDKCKDNPAFEDDGGLTCQSKTWHTKSQCQEWGGTIFCKLKTGGVEEWGGKGKPPKGCLNANTACCFCKSKGSGGSAPAPADDEDEEPKKKKGKGKGGGSSPKGAPKGPHTFAVSVKPGNPEIIRIKDWVIWDEGDKMDLKPNSIGFVARFDSKGVPVVSFSGKKRKIPPHHLTLLPKFSIGDKVVWSSSDKDVPAGTIGEVVRIDSKNFSVVSFKYPAQGKRKRIHPMALKRVNNYTKGAEVAYKPEGASSSDKVRFMRMDPKGKAVIIVKLPGASSKDKSKYDTKHVPLSELRSIHPFKKGDSVVIEKDEARPEGVPENAGGEIVRFNKKCFDACAKGTGEAVVKFLGGKLVKHVSTAILKIAPTLTAGESVVWTGHDDKVPLGTVGVFKRFSSNGDALVSYGGDRKRIPRGELIGLGSEPGHEGDDSGKGLK